MCIFTVCNPICPPEVPRDDHTQSFYIGNWHICFEADTTSPLYSIRRNQAIWKSGYERKTRTFSISCAPFPSCDVFLNLNSFLSLNQRSIHKTQEHYTLTMRKCRLF